MKKIKMNKKLFLEKKSISRLDDAALDGIQGGGGSSSCPATYTCQCSSCPTWSCPER